MYKSQIGYGYSMQQYLRLAADFAMSLKKKSATDAEFAQSWYEGFKKGNPTITLAKAQILTLLRAKCTLQGSYFIEVF